MSYNINKENAIANRGNWSRIKELMKRAQAGESLTMGFLGGSITQGCLASRPNLCYAYRVYSWWCRTFPQSSFRYINAGIGGTTSQFGVARVGDDLLSSHPDFVILEFSVNDDSTEHFCETYEGLVRKVVGAKEKPAVLLVHNVCYDSGANAQLWHSRVGRHYDLPGVSMQSSIFPEVVAGRIENREITEDDLHPNDKGHELVADVIIYFLEKVLAEIGQPEAEMAKEMPQPLTRNRYENSVRYQSRNSRPVLAGFAADKEPQGNITDVFKRGWYANDKKSRITFQVEGKCVAVQYRKAVAGGAPIVKATIDHDEEHALILDGNFPGGWGNKLELTTLIEHDVVKKHVVELQVIKEGEGHRLPFYLVSLIVSQ